MLFKVNFKKTILVFFVFFLFSCASNKTATSLNPDLYKVLVSNDYGGASFQFYEIISEENEFKVLQNDKILKKLVKSDDIKSCNFILLNMGEKDSTGYSVEVKDIKELTDKIVITIEEKKPDSRKKITEAVTNPYSVLKIHSKKPIEIK